MKRILSMVAVVAIVFLVSQKASWNMFAAGPGNGAGGCSEQVVAQKIGERNIEFFDDTRRGYHAPDVPRPITAQLWYPSPDGDNSFPKEQKLPLVVFSHGNGGNSREGWFAEKLAQAGYLVAALNHQGNTTDFSIPQGLLKMWDRPLDVKVFIDKLLASELGSHVDCERIGVAGFSFGGLTSIWAAGGRPKEFSNYDDMYKKSGINFLDVGGFDYLKGWPKLTEQTYKGVNFKDLYTDVHHPLIRAVFAMAPDCSGLFTDESLQAIKVPVFVTYGEVDKLILRPHPHRYVEFIPNAQERVFTGKVGHFVFLREFTEEEKYFTPDVITKDDPSVDRKAIHDEVTCDAINFFNKALNIR